MKRLVPPRAVVFDLDGTLLDSLPLVLESIAHALEPFGRKPAMEIFARLGGPPERFLPTLLDDLAHVPIARQRMETFHHQNCHLIRPFDGVERLLDGLRVAGVRVAIWTGRDRESTERLLGDHGIDGYFATVVCGDDLPTHKPDPEGLREIMRRLDVQPADTLFVGDADVDVLGGVACGVDTVLIKHTREIEPRISAQCWHSVASPLEAFETVLSCLVTSSKPR
jgi:pyrophosphatase PpaX